MSRPLSLLSGIHRLHAFLHVPATPLLGTAVVCHPHPAHGGHMDHPVVRLAAERATAAGLLALRFDFRGVRGSEGEVTDPEGHLQDVRSAAREVRRRAGEGAGEPAGGEPAGGAGPLLGAGFSYGARALTRLLGRDHPPPFEGLLLLAPATRVPTTPRDFGNLLLGRPLDEASRDPEALRALGALEIPVELLVGDRDGVAPPDELRGAMPPQGRIEVLEGLNHFFSRGRGASRTDEETLASHLDRAWRALIPRSTGG